MTALLVLLLALLQSQSVMATFEGFVLGPGDAPLAGIEVMASPKGQFRPDEVVRGVTRADGRFVLSGLSRAGYLITVKTPGYVAQTHDVEIQAPRDVGQDRPAVAPVQPLIIRLAADGVIAGRITSTTGEPVMGLRVMALRKSYNAWGGGVFKQQGDVVGTDDRGDYRISGLPAGEFYVFAESLDPKAMEMLRVTAKARGEIPPASPSPQRYASQFYPGVPESRLATRIDLADGERRERVDFSVPRAPVYTVQGRLVDPTTPTPPSSGGLMGFRDMNGEHTSFIVVSVGPFKQNGAFEFTDVTPGTYWINAGDMYAPAGAQVTVSDTDVTNVEMKLMRNLRLQGRVRAETPLAPEATARLKVQLRTMPPFPESVVESIVVGEDGSFTSRGLYPRPYRIGVSEIPPDLYLREVRLGGVDALASTILLTETPRDSLEIVLGRATTVTGRVSDNSGASQSPAQIVLIPEDQTLLHLYRSAAADNLGRFSIVSVAPGNYRALAWRTMEPYRYFDPEFIQRYADKGIVVSISSTAPQELSLPVIP